MLAGYGIAFMLVKKHFYKNKFINSNKVVLTFSGAVFFLFLADPGVDNLSFINARIISSVFFSLHDSEIESSDQSKGNRKQQCKASSKFEATIYERRENSIQQCDEIVYDCVPRKKPRKG